MALLSADSFNRAANSSSLGSTDGAGSLDPQAWTANQGTWGIATSTTDAYSPVIGSGNSQATIDVATGDVDITMPIFQGSSQGNGLFFRWSATNNYWLVWCSTTSNLGLFKNVAGTLTQVGSNHTVANGDTIRVVANGSSITMYRNGVSQETTTDSFNSTATKVGMRIDGTSVRINSFSVSSIDTTTTVTGTQATETDSSTSGTLSVFGAVYPAAGDRVLALKTETSDSWYGFLT